MGLTHSYLVYDKEFGEKEKDSPQQDYRSENKCLKYFDCSKAKMVQSVPYLISDLNFLDCRRKVSLLSEGATLFDFYCTTGNRLFSGARQLVDIIVNVSGFNDEVKENASIKININSPSEASLYTIILTKVAYILPDIDLELLSPQLIASDRYQKACVPGDPYVWPDMPDNQTFRITKVIISYIYSMTIQLRVSEVTKKEDLEKINKIDNIKYDKVFVLERTKRNTSTADATAKVKSIIAYKKVNGGIYMNNTTVVLNTNLPSFLTPFVDKLGHFGASESAQTAIQTRNFFKTLK